MQNERPQSEDAQDERPIMALDYGRRRIGVALSDASHTLASPLTTLQRRAGKRIPMARINELARSHRVAQVVVGLPLETDGSESEWTAEVRNFGQQIGERTGLPVTFQDERYSSAEAERLIREIGLPRKKREDKAKIDAGAAAIILQDWLDAQE